MTNISRKIGNGTATQKDLALSLLTKITSFQFLITFVCVKSETIRPLASKLQQRDPDLFEAVNLIDERIQRVKEMRSEIVSEFNTWYEDSERIANELDIEVTMHRVCGRQTQRPNANRCANPCEYFRTNVAIPFLDYLLQELNSRFQKDVRPGTGKGSYK